MKQITINGTAWGFVEVPEDAKDFSIGNFSNRLYFELNGRSESIRVSKEPYSIVCKASEVTEEQAKGIVQKYDDLESVLGNCYYNYENIGDFVLTATESLYSLIRSLGMEPGTTVILKQVK